MNVTTRPDQRTLAPPAAPAAARPPAPRWYLPAVLAAVALGAVNAFVGLGSNSVARDEGFSISTSVRGWSSFVRLSIHTETNAWLYALVLKVWSFVSTSPGWLRAPSAIAFVVTVALVAELGRRLFSPRVAVIAAALVALNGSMLMFAQQIRGYGFAVAFATAATVVFVAEVRRPSRLALVGWALLVVATASSHLHQVSVVLPQLAALFALPAAERRWRRRIGALAVTGVVVVPLAVAISSHEEGQGLFSLRPGVFRDVLYTYAGRAGVVGVVAFTVAGVALLASLRGLVGRGAGATAPGVATLEGTERFGRVLLAAWLVLPFTAMLLASLLQPTLIGRYLLFCVPAMVLAMALLVDRLASVAGPRRPLALAGAALLVLGACRGSVSWHLDSKTEHWDEVAAYVFSHAQPQDRLVVANDSVRLFFEYERMRRSETPIGPVPAYPPQPWGDYGTGDQRYLSPSEAELAAVAAGAQRLWVVVGHNHVDTEVMAQRLRALEPAFRVTDHRSFPVEIDVYLYERAAP